jgi:hypothetical protein
MDAGLSSQPCFIIDRLNIHAVRYVVCTACFRSSTVDGWNLGRYDAGLDQVSSLLPSLLRKESIKFSINPSWREERHTSCACSRLMIHGQSIHAFDAIYCNIDPADSM